MSKERKIKYHLSYDIEADKEDYNYYKQELLCIIKSTNPLNVSSPCASTIIIEYYEHFKEPLIRILKNNLDYSIYSFYISMIKDDENNNFYLGLNKNVELNKQFRDEYKKIECD
ncbi:hypothetical protein HMPREF9714_03358 [Myroides odoratimimus CCUG 12901]|uniref:hypothetical protein n=1 Tax=Myroides odoratimimus TaxID=76832 RepID=UPI000246115D|nr:hypothetical protein [Myroides odoratimimus]EHO05420.1 hypothetical protein HMPREF9714_03358 [Myroides odoratimimus CCUG 12901]